MCVRMGEVGSVEGRVITRAASGDVCVCLMVRRLAIRRGERRVCVRRGGGGWFRVLGFGFWVLGFEFWVLGFGFWDES